MHFGSFYLDNYVILFGGTLPTSLKFSPIDEGSSGESSVYILNLKGARWGALVAPRDTTSQMDIPIEIAKNEIIRAKNRLQSERDKGFMLGKPLNDTFRLLQRFAIGAKNGLTVEVFECEAVLEVCKWRLRMLYQERDELRNPPHQRWGHTLVCRGQRAYLIGGWTSFSAAAREDVLILDFEDDLERRRRQELEFNARLDRERIAEERRILNEEILTKHELEVLLRADRERESMESQKMREEEIRCSFPPLYKPCTIKFVKANRSTIWLEWDPVRENSRGQPVDSSQLIYMLYKQAGLKVLLKGDRVSVFQGSSSRVPYFEGTITSLNLKSSTFTVKYDFKRGIEKGITRDRIAPISLHAPRENLLNYYPLEEKCTIDVDSSKWVLLYMGNATSYACTNLVSETFIDRDSDHPYSFTFAHQVLGVDYPLYERSQLSDPVTFSTANDKNPFIDEWNVDRKRIYRCTGPDGVALQFERRDVEFYSVGTFDHFI